MESRKVYKTTTTVSVGFSIQDENGNWVKSNVQIAAESGPGYPSKDEIGYMIAVQMQDACESCNDQIGEIAKKIVDRENHLRKGGQ